MKRASAIIRELMDQVMPRWDDLDTDHKSLLVHQAQLYLRGIGETKPQFGLHPDDDKIVWDMAERAELDRDWIEDRLSFIASNLIGEINGES
jgi:hypothetical protein